jgi:hypothetical protein|tara:strand:+ start:617 stop:1018 length:402 start_codon:yes stop_codon:yes gene_type:complete
MTDQNTDWLIEFVHGYDDGYFVTKRGLDATPVVVKKFDLGVDGVMAFTCHQRANKALTAFHFHPDFPPEDRQEYMRRHAEGHELVLGIGSPLAALRARKMRVFEERVSGIGRSLAVRLQTAALFLAAGGSMTR